MLGTPGEVAKGPDQSFVNLETQGPAVRRSPVHGVQAHFHSRTWEGRVRTQVLHLCAQERNTNSGAKHTNADYACIRQQSAGSNLHTPARATPSGHAETQAESLSPSESRPPQGRGLSSTRGRHSEDKMSQRDFASLLIPLYPASRLRNKTSLHPYNPAISSCTV